MYILYEPSISPSSLASLLHRVPLRTVHVTILIDHDEAIDVSDGRLDNTSQTPWVPLSTDDFRSKTEGASIAMPCNALF